MMKRNFALGMVVGLLLMALPAWAGWSKKEMRHDVRFLTDRMAYELRLSPQQYDDVYEVNYDFLSQVRYLSKEVMCGYGYALERYYDCLDIRNDDLRWILTRAQYYRFLRLEHFYRPFCAHHNHFHLRVYLVYDDCDHFYYGRPHHYHTYCGGHYRTHYHNVSYYRTHRHPHYRHDVYEGHYRIRQDRATFDRHSRRDFLVGERPQRHPEARPVRPGRGERPEHRPEVRPVRRPEGISHRPDERPEHRRVNRSERVSNRRDERRQEYRSEPRNESRRVRRSETGREKRTDRANESRQRRGDERTNYRTL